MSPLRQVLASTYPGLGIAYFIKTPALWGKVCFHIFIATSLVLVGAGFLLGIGMPLQAQWIAKSLPLGWAWTIAVFLCLIEIIVATLLVGLIYLQAFAMDTLFDTVMLQHGIDLAAQKSPSHFKRGFYRFLHPILYMLMTLVVLPVNLIPGLGQYVFSNFLFLGDVIYIILIRRI